MCRGGRELDLGFPQQRALLGLLLVRAGRPVPMGEIVDVLWDRKAPASATNVVRRYAGSLRRLLEPGLPPRAPGRRVLRRSGGYLLEADETEVDLLRFRVLTKRAKRAVATGRPEVALGHFVEALGGWRGPVAMGVPSSVREHAVFTAVEREIVHTVRMAADAALLCGRTEYVVPQLRRAVGLDPLNESLHARLVMALAVSGLQAEALAAYEDVRRLLAAELGLSPGAELTAAHTRVLRQELRRTRTAPAHMTPTAPPPPPTAPNHQTPTPPPPPPPPPPPTAPNHQTPTPPPDPPAPLVRPAQLQPDLKVFSGRRAELAVLRELTDAIGPPRERRPAPRRRPDSPGAPATVLISGMPGIGKTTLAVHWAHTVADRFPDGQLYVDLKGFAPSGSRAPLDASEALRGMLTALGVAPRHLPVGLDALTGRYRDLLAGRRLLVLLDDAAGTEQVLPLLPASPGCLTLVTSRTRLPGLTASGARPLRLDLPSAVDARAALALRMGRARLAAEPDAADEIVACCGRLPLALAVVAARAISRPDFPLTAIAAELRRARGSLEAFSGSAGGAADVRDVFAVSYRRLSPQGARLFRLLSLHPGPHLTVDTVAAVAGLPVPSTRPLLDELADAHLVVAEAPGHYVLHELLRVFAAELTAGESSDADEEVAEGADECADEEADWEKGEETDAAHGK